MGYCQFRQFKKKRQENMYVRTRVCTGRLEKARTGRVCGRGRRVEDFQEGLVEYQGELACGEEIKV